MKTIVVTVEPEDEGNHGQSFYECKLEEAEGNKASVDRISDGVADCPSAALEAAAQDIRAYMENKGWRES